MQYCHILSMYIYVVSDLIHWTCLRLLSQVSIDLSCQYYRRKFRSETSDNMDSWKAEVRRVRRDKIRRKKMQMREKVGKSRNTVFFQWFVAPGSKSRLAKAAGAEPAGQMRDEKLHAVVARSTFPSQMYKTHQNTSASDHFWKLRCRKSARGCGAKHISRSKCTKHTSSGPLLAVEMLKKCTRLWREAHFEVKMYKTHQVRTTFGSWDVEKVHAVVARSTFRSQNVKKKKKKKKSTRSGPLLEVAMLKKCTPLWREAHFEVKMYKTHHARTTFGGSDVEKVSKKCTPLWREAHFEVKSVKNWVFWVFFDVKMSKK